MGRVVRSVQFFFLNKIFVENDIYIPNASITIQYFLSTK